MVPLELGSPVSQRDRVPEMPHATGRIEDSIPAHESCELGPDRASWIDGVDADVQMVLLREDPPVAARHASKIEEHAAAEPGRLVRRHRDQRLDGRRITHQAAPEDRSPDRAEDSVGADDVSGFEHAAGRGDHDTITGLLCPDKRRAPLKPCARRNGFPQEEVVELRSQNESSTPAAQVFHDCVLIPVGQERACHTTLHDRSDVERQQLDRLVGQPAAADLVPRKHRLVDDRDVETAAREQIAQEGPCRARANDRDVRTCGHELRGVRPTALNPFSILKNSAICRVHL